jgi:hypothetical protein
MATITLRQAKGAPLTISEVDANFSSLKIGADIAEAGTNANTANTLVKRDATGNFSAGTITASLLGNASTATTAVNATNITTAEDAATNTSYYPVFQTGINGTNPLKTTSTKFTFNPSTGTLTASNLAGSGSAITGLNADNLASGTVPASRLTGTYGISITGNAATATALQTARTISLSGDVTGSVSFNGTANADIVATIQPNSVALGADTTGNYVATVSGTADQVLVSGAAGEGTATVLSLPQSIATTSSPTFANVSATSNPSAPNHLVNRDFYYRQIWKDPVRVAATVNINLAAPGTAIDSVTLAVGESFLAPFQTTASENGIYVFNGSAVPATRRVDADTSAKVVGGTRVHVMEGANFSDTQWVLITNNPITLGTTALVFSESLSQETRGIAQLANVNGIITRTGLGSFVARTLAVAGSGLTITNADGVAGNPTITSNATSANTANTIVLRDATGNFSAGTITANLTGVALNATNVNIISDVAAGDKFVTFVDLQTGFEDLKTNVNLKYNSGTGQFSIPNILTTGNVTVGGNLVVNGTTTTVNSTTVTIDDPVFTVGGDTPPATDDNKDRGIEFRYHNGTTAKLGFFGFDDSTGFMTFIPDAVNTAEVFSGAVGVLDVQRITGSAATLTTPRTITLAGDVAGSASFDGSSNITITATVQPDSVALGTDTTGNYVATASVSGVGLTGSATGEGSTFTVTSNATSANTSNTIVSRDASGNFAAGTISANLNGNASTATATVATVTGTNSTELVRGNMADNDQFRILVGGTATNAGFVEFATSDDGTEPMFFRQYTGETFTTVVRTATILGASGETSFPVIVTAPTFQGALTGNASTATTLQTARNVSITGNAAAAAVSFNGSGDVVLNVTSLTAGGLTGTIPSGVLGNSTAFVGTTAIALNRASANQALTGISSVALPGATSGTITLTPTSVAGTTTITLPATTGTLITSGDTGTVTSTMILDGTIVNADINAAAGIVDTKLATIATAGKVANTATTATSANTANAIVARNASGNFDANSITLVGDIDVNGGDISTTSSITTIFANAQVSSLYLGPLGTTAVPATHFIDIGAAQMASGKIKNVTIGANGVAGSTTIVDIGPLATAASTINLRGNTNLQAGRVFAFSGATSGTITLTPTAVAGTTTLTLPATSGTLITSGDTGTVTSTMILDGTIVNADINAAAGIVDTKLATITTTGKVANTATTATSANSANAIVSRDASGNFSAGTITASLNGNANTATSATTATTATTATNQSGGTVSATTGSFSTSLTAPTVAASVNNTTVATTEFANRAAIDAAVALAIALG